jgi:hypothetical protein
MASSPLPASRAAASDTPFTDIVVELPVAGAVAWCDYDHDGDLDLAVVGSTPQAAMAAIYRNDGHNTFTDIHAVLTPAWAAAVGWADIDHDGDPDLIVVGQTDKGPASMIYRNANGTFMRIETRLVGAAFSSIAWGDCDNDGRPDLVIAGSNHTRLYTNRQGTLEESPVRLPGVQFGSLGWADYDGDGDLDLAVAGEYNTGWSCVGVGKLYANDGRGVLTEVLAGLPPLTHSSLAWADYDRDGDPDLAMAGFARDGSAVSLILRNDRGRFIDIQADLLGLGSGALAWGDYDGNGDADLLVTGMFYYEARRYCGTRLYRHESKDTFRLVPVTIDGLHDGSVAWGDYDGDGRPDLAISGADCDGRAITRIYRNQSRSGTTQPAPQAGPSRPMD